MCWLSNTKEINMRSRNGISLGLRCANLEDELALEGGSEFLEYQLSNAFLYNIL